MSSYWRLESERILTTDDAYQNHNDRDHEKDVDKSADSVRGNEAQKPEYEQYDCDGY